MCLVAVATLAPPAYAEEGPGWTDDDLRAQALADDGRYAEAAEAGQAAVDAYLSSGSYDPRQYAALVSALADYQASLGEITAIRKTLKEAVKTIRRHSDDDAASAQELADIYIHLVSYEQDTAHYRRAEKALDSWEEMTEQLHGPESINALLAQLDQSVWVLDHLRYLHSLRSRQFVSPASAQRIRHRHLLDELKEYSHPSARLIHLAYRADFLERFENDPDAAEAALLEFFAEFAVRPSNVERAGVQRASARAARQLYGLYRDQNRQAEADRLLIRLAKADVGIGADQPLYRPAPRFSEEAEAPGIRGWINVDIDVGAEGEVTDVSVNSAYGNAEFVRDFVSAIRSWIFLPAIVDGEAAPREIISAQFETVSPENRRRISARRRSRAR